MAAAIAANVGNDYYRSAIASGISVKSQFNAAGFFSVILTSQIDLSFFANK
jgi:hypothetical protein